MRPGWGGTVVSSLRRVTPGCTARAVVATGAVGMGAAGTDGAPAFTRAVWKKARWAAVRASLAGAGEFACGWMGRPVIGGRAKV